MNPYKQQFPKKHTLLPVIHVDDLDQTLHNLSIALECGADGAFLINHTVESPMLQYIYMQARKEYPSFWMGMNDLNQSPIGALQAIQDDGGIWCDNAGVTDEGVSHEARRFKRTRERMRWSGIYFGGVAFKHQTRVHDPGKAAELAKGYVDVITTSGAKTGSAPPIEQLASMRAAVGDDYPIANASGMTPENVYQYKPYVDCFLVATGISRSFTRLDPARLRDFVEAIRA